MEEVEINSILSNIEKESTIIIGDDGVLIHSDHRTGIKWCLQRIEDGLAELNYVNKNEDGSINSIGIKSDYTLVSLKSKPRKQNNISNIFSI
jgi:hypothetical protein